ncbi:MAG: DUF1080 domain-containing protein [Bacteroidota bacterium]
MIRNLLLLSLCLLIWACSPTAQTTIQNEKEEWISLFNGKDLSGWDIKIAGRELNDNFLNTFVVEDEILRIKYDEYDEFGTLFGHLYYEKPYSYYKFRFEYRFVGEQTKGGASWNVRNSGVMFHSQSAQSLSFNQHFPVSIELQTLGGLNKGERHTANLCTPGTMVEYKGKLDQTHCISSSSKTYHGDQWVAVEVVVLGDSVVHHIIESDTVLTFMKPMVDSTFISAGNGSWESFGVENGDYWKAKHGELLASGHIALQAESHPIDFRNIELLDLEGCMDKKAKNYRSYYLKHKGEDCLY